jgi:AcrR family transcriptional regulator
MCASRADRSATISANRKAQILEAAKQVFSAKGFSQTSTAEIAEVAGVSQGTVFYYYPTKYDLFIELVHQYLSIECIPDKLNALSEGDIQSRFREIMKERLTKGFDNIDLMLLVLGEIQRDQKLLKEYSARLIKPVLNKLETFLKGMGGKKRNLKKARLVARLIMAAIIGFVVLRKIEGEDGLLEQTPPAEIADMVSRVIIDGLNSYRDFGKTK